MGKILSEHEIVTSYLQVLDDTGLLWAEKNSSGSGCESNQKFTVENVSMIVKKVNKTDMEKNETCFSFYQGSVCLPRGLLQVWFTLFE